MPYKIGNKSYKSLTDYRRALLAAARDDPAKKAKAIATRTANKAKASEMAKGVGRELPYNQTGSGFQEGKAFDAEMSMDGLRTVPRDEAKGTEFALPVAVMDQDYHKAIRKKKEDAVYKAHAPGASKDTKIKARRDLHRLNLDILEHEKNMTRFLKKRAGSTHNKNVFDAATKYIDQSQKYMKSNFEKNSAGPLGDPYEADILRKIRDGNINKRAIPKMSQYMEGDESSSEPDTPMSGDLDLKTGRMKQLGRRSRKSTTAKNRKRNPPVQQIEEEKKEEEPMMEQIEEEEKKEEEPPVEQIQEENNADRIARNIEMNKRQVERMLETQENLPKKDRGDLPSKYVITDTESEEDPGPVEVQDDGEPEVEEVVDRRALLDGLAQNLIQRRDPDMDPVKPRAVNEQIRIRKAFENVPDKDVPAWLRDERDNRRYRDRIAAEKKKKTEEKREEQAKKRAEKQAAKDERQRIRDEKAAAKEANQKK